MSEDATLADARQVAQRALAKANELEEQRRDLEEDVDAIASDIATLEEIIDDRADGSGADTEGESQ